MEKSYYSSSWYRVADLKPRLRSHARIHRHHFRGELWYVLQDRTSGRFHRFKPAAYLIISLMNGDRSVQEIWDIACTQLDDEILTQDEFIMLLGQLHSADVLYGDVPPDIDELSERGRRQTKKKLVMSFMNPLAVRIPLIDPDDFLTATLPLVRPLFSWFGALVFIVMIVYAGILAGAHWSQLTENIADRVLATENIVLLLLAYPLIKLFHELGHGYAIKRWGGDVHEIGIMFLVFMPVPYVDASDSMAFHEKWRRALVAAAGIIVELFLASVALLVWLNAEEGLVRAFAYNVMLIGGVSTVLFNGNPLLRFDGYYVLCDVLEMPNLATRATRYLGYLLQRYGFGVESAQTSASARGEPFWLFTYALAAFAYRIFITVVIVMFVSTQFYVIGVLIAIWAVILMVGVPLAKHIWFLLANPALRRSRGRAFAVVGGVLAVIAGGLAAVPLPYSTIAEGVVWVPGAAAVHASAEGVVAEVLAIPNSHVEIGTPLLQLEDPLLAVRVRLMEWRVRELNFRYLATNLIDPAAAKVNREELRYAEADLALARERDRNLLVLSKTSGQLILQRVQDLPGRFVRKGDVLAYVGRFDDPVIRVIVTEDRADLVRQRTRAIHVRFVSDPSLSISAVIEREVPTLTTTLPSKALSTLGGGVVALDPTDVRREKTLANMLHLDLKFAEPRRIEMIGQRVYVRFFHGQEPLAARIYRSLRQVFLKHFNV